jgi:hypothetical protein
VAEVTLYVDANTTINIVSELKQMGWVLGVDFDFAYYKPEYDNFTYTNNYDPIQERRAVFIFYNDSNASYFMLRWG